MIKVVQWFNPYNIIRALDAIDQEQPSYTLNRQQALRRVLITLACVCVCLLIINYLKNHAALVGLLKTLASWQGVDQNSLVQEFYQGKYAELLGYCWWTFWHLVGFIIIPFIVIKFILKERFRSMGWHWGETHKHWRGYVCLLTPILFFIVLVSQGDDFVSHYPFYKLAGRSWIDFILWEALYLTQFVCLEFFFRGFVIQSLRPAVGANAVWIMCVPYLMIHFPKLWLEATGAIFFGLFLGILALRSRSIWGGFFVHAGVAVGMDVSSLFVQGKIPNVLFP